MKESTNESVAEVVKDWITEFEKQYVSGEYYGVDNEIECSLDSIKDSKNDGDEFYSECNKAFYEWLVEFKKEHPSEEGCFDKYGEPVKKEISVIYYPYVVQQGDIEVPIYILNRGETATRKYIESNFNEIEFSMPYDNSEGFKFDITHNFKEK